jgi:hypothetical protein
MKRFGRRKGKHKQQRLTSRKVLGMRPSFPLAFLAIHQPSGFFSIIRRMSPFLKQNKVEGLQ